MAQEKKKKEGSLCKYTQHGLFNLIIVLYIHVYTCVQYYWIKAGLVVQYMVITVSMIVNFKPEAENPFKILT